VFVVLLIDMKTTRQMERHIKGIANHHRIAILLLIAENKRITLEKIVEKIRANEKTIGEHTRRLVTAGLVDKEYNGKFVEHMLTPYGRMFVNFLLKFQNTQ